MAQGDVPLMREECVVRGRLLRNAPHFTKNQLFVIPAQRWFDELEFSLGLIM